MKIRSLFLAALLIGATATMNAQNEGIQPSDSQLDKEEATIILRANERLGFESGSARITESSHESLDALAVLLGNHPTFQLRLEGHTDNVGNRDKNLKLSTDRANAVKAFLVSRGVAEARIQAQGFGSTKPVGENETEEGRRRNRRVEMGIAE